MTIDIPRPSPRCYALVPCAGSGSRVLDLGQLLGHAVEADVDLADFAGGHFLVEVAGVEVAAAHPAGGEGQLLQRLVDEPRDESGARQRHHRGHGQPDKPGLAAQRAQARSVDLEPPGVLVDQETDPQAVLAVDPAGHDGAGAEATRQLLGDSLVQAALVERLHLVTRLARLDAQRLLIGQGLDQRDPRDGVGVDQRGAAELDQRGDLLRHQQRAGFVFQRAKRLQPGHGAAKQQQREHGEGAPEQAQAEPRARLQWGRCGFQRDRGGGRVMRAARGRGPGGVGVP